MLDVLKALAPTPWLAALDTQGRSLLTSSARLITFRPGRRMVRAGDAVREVFVLLSGTVRLGAPVVDRGSTLVAVRGPNALLGASEVIANEPARSEAVTLEATTVLAIPSEVFMKLVETEPKFAIETTRELSRLNQELQDQAGLLAPLPVTVRLRQLLLRYATTCGTPLEDGIRLRPKLTQASLALDLGVERKSVLRAMDQLRELGLLDKRNARYHLPRPSELERWRPASVEGSESTESSADAEALSDMDDDDSAEANA